MNCEEKLAELQKEVNRLKIELLIANKMIIELNKKLKKYELAH